MKAMKLVFKLLVCVVVLVVAAVLALPLWFGPVAKSVANSVAPGIVKTDFRIGHLSLNPYTARFELGAMNLGNPQGCSVKDAVRVGDIIFDAETLSLLSDVIHVEEVTVRDLFVSVVSDRNGVLNFKQIQYNVAGGREKYEAAQSEKEAAAASEQDAPESARETDAKKPAKKIVIDRLEVSGLTLQLSILPIRIPSVVLTDIGRKEGGATLENAWRQILDGVMKAAGVTGDQLKALGALSGDAVKKANEAVSKATEQASAVLGDASKQLSEHAEKASAAVNGVTKQLSEVPSAEGITGAAAGVVNDGAKAVDEGVKAVGDGAKKALDSLKGLW